MAPVFIRSLALVAVRCRYRHGSDPVGEFSFLRIGTGPNPRILCKVSGECGGRLDKTGVTPMLAWTRGRG